MTTTLKRLALALTAGCFALAAPSPELFDGRLLDGKVTLPGPSLADLPALEDEVKRQADRPYLRFLANGAKVTQTGGAFSAKMGPIGSFTRPGARQKSFLYRLGLSSGLIILEEGKVVAHYNGVAADYAHYIYAYGLDLNADGLTDLVLNHNSEDSEAIEAHCFLMTAQGPVFLGATPVFRSDLMAGDGKKVAATSDAYVVRAIPGARPRFTRDAYRRAGGSKWVSESSGQPLSLDNQFGSGFEPALIRLAPAGPVDQARMKEALGKLADYADVGSSIDYVHPTGSAETRVAANPELRLMELLDTRAALYAWENATKQLGDHTRPRKYALSLRESASVDDIRQAYIKHTNDSLGGMSPYLPTGRQ